MYKIIIQLTILFIFFQQAACVDKNGGTMNNEDLKKKLTSLQYHVTQENGTEKPFKNEYWNNKKPGIYVGIVSGEPLFSSMDKFASGTGWPSFTRPLDKKNITTKTDDSLFITRIEVRSKKGNSHLGHVFSDGPEPTGKRYCLNSAALKFIPAENLQKEGYGQYKYLFEDEKKTELATFAAGCFWGIEEILSNIPGVIETTVGYTGGTVEDPDYETISTGKTGHAEAIQIKYDPNIITYEKLLDYFWRLHDPTTLNRQGYDTGTQYRSAIFYHNDDQKKSAEKSKTDFNRSGVFKDKAVTEISHARKFYSAEDYHQNYYKKNKGRVCHILRDK